MSARTRDIEGKTARVAARERGRDEFKRLSEIESKAARAAAKERGSD